jgi:hypothetical protein
MMTAADIKRLQTAVASQQAGNNVYGSIGLKGGFACTDIGGVLGAPVGPFAVVPQTGPNVGCYRVYPKAPNGQPWLGTQGTIISIDFINVNGFTPRNPTVAETAAAMVTGWGIDSGNNQWYVTVQIATLGTWALLATPPTNFVVGVEMAVSFSLNANPL